MQTSIPSRTALGVALRRAAHQIYDTPPLVFEDPIAVRILGPQYSDNLRKTATKLHKPFSIALRAFVVARSRYAEDTLAAAVARGTTQYVLLGAGLDTFAYRNPHPHLRVFEVDHPATQQWKRNLLAANSIAVPTSLSFIPLDFEPAPVGQPQHGGTQTSDTHTPSNPRPESAALLPDDGEAGLREAAAPLGSALLATGFDPGAPTLFAMLGVVPYLTRDAFRTTLSFIAGCAPGSGLVLDYTLPRHALLPHEQLARDSLAARVQLAGEPFQLFFTPAEIAAELASTTPPFHHIEDLGPTQITARYFPPRLPKPANPLALRGTAGHFLSAHV